jgi:parallel beta-helix repeat protein
MKAPTLALAIFTTLATHAAATDYYVRQTVGDDHNDGLSAATAWQSVTKLSTAMKAGDTAYVGPGLYRGAVIVLHDGTADQRLVFIADATGQHTGDPPGTVMITGAEPVEESVFAPDSASGVFAAEFPGPVLGVVEMDGPQHRYKRAGDTKEHLADKLSELEVVAKLPSSFFYDEGARVLHLHTSDGNHPKTHEIELIRRGNGISMVGKHHVTVVGFTFRHVGDAGINFFKASGEGIAIGNTSYGSRQGIRVYGAKDILIYGNTFFRNDNSGVYFAAKSSDGVAIGNISYENVKGIRWSSESVYGIAADNVLFDNRERGISIEKADHAVVRGNKLVNNRQSQLLVIDAKFSSEGNCFDNGPSGPLIADFLYRRFNTLAEYQQDKRQDLSSREGSCGPLPPKVDVQALHRETMGYAERARKLLRDAPQPSPSATSRARRRLVPPSSPRSPTTDAGPRP